MRHATRNKLAIIRNAATYIRRKVGASDAWTADPRIDMFYQMLESELEDANDLLEPRELLTHVFVREIAPSSAAACVQTAIDSAHLPPRVSVRSEAAAGTVNVDARELALAVRCLLVNAGEAGASVHVVGRVHDTSYLLEVSDSGRGPAHGASIDKMTEPFFTTKPGHVGLGLNVAKRIAHRYGGKLTLATRDEGGLLAAILVPLMREGGAG